MADRKGQPAGQPSPAHDPAEDRLLNAWLASADETDAEMRQSYLNARARAAARPAPHLAETASRYRQAAAHLRDLADHGDYEGCEYVRDEMAMCRCQLAASGRLDLIGANA